MERLLALPVRSDHDTRKDAPCSIRVFDDGDVTEKAVTADA